MGASLNAALEWRDNYSNFPWNNLQEFRCLWCGNCVGGAGLKVRRKRGRVCACSARSERIERWGGGHDNNGGILHI